MEKNHQLIFLLISLFATGLSQEYPWPLKLDKLISSNFGEYRPRHFHAGIDIKTNRSIGQEVLAIGDGYIWRIKVSSGGYGKVIYLKLNNGNIAVYGHLDRFIPILNDIIKLEQSKRNAYTLDKYFGSKEFLVHQGDILGYTGDTGIAYAPHLHFELRDATNRPLNPLTHGFTLYDKRLPVPEVIAIVPLSKDAWINGSLLPQTFPLQRTKTDEYVFPDTIHVFGTVGIEISAQDQISNMNGKYNIQGALLTVDGIDQYRIEFDHFPYDQAHLIEVERDYSIIRLNEGEFHRLFATKPARFLDFIDPNSKGQLLLSPGYHKVNIKLFDHAKNVVKIKGTLYSAPPIHITASPIKWGDSTVSIRLKPTGSPFPITDFVCYSFKKKGFVEQKVDALSKQRDGRDLLIELPIDRVDHHILQFIGINKLGAVSRPFHLPLHISPADYMTVNTKLKISHLPTSVVFQIETDSYISQHPHIVLRQKNRNLSIDFNRITPTAFLSNPIDPQEMANVDETVITIEGSSIREIKIHLKPNVSSHNQPSAVLSTDGNCSLQALPTTFYETTAFWIEEVENPVPVKGGKFISKTYQLQPFDRPLQDSARIAIKLSESIQDYHHQGIFYYDQKEGWTYLPSRFTEKKWMFFSSIYSLEAVAIIQDTIPPIIKNIFPGNGGYYHYPDLKEITATIEDDLAGIRNEKSITMSLDGKKLIFEYQPIKKRARYRLDSPLNKGNHTLFIDATDQVGNSITKEVHFSVN